MSRRAWPIALALALLPAAAAADNCTSVGSAGITFGPYNPFAGDRDVTGFVGYTCTKSSTPRIRLGTGGSGTFAPRRLAGAGYSLGYNLYTDPGRVTVWGDGSAGTATVIGPAPAAKDVPVSVPVYGRIFRSQPVAAGTYADLLVVTLDF